MNVLRVTLSALLACLCACSFRGGTRVPGGSAGEENREDQEDQEDREDLAYDRSGCGRARLPFWAALTPPEVEALEGRERAMAGDARALLDLAIFASGDVRDAAGYARIRKRFESFAERERTVLAGEKDPRQKAYRLHRDMHAAFFAGGAAAEGEARPGYDWEQSRLTGIFADGKYNCVSSALLYLILAREFGFRAEGVLLPSHAFAQLTLEDGKRIEVETTAPEGFDWTHDEAFYAGRASAFFSARGLPASTFSDYRKRRILPPHLLVAGNMWNQHSSSRRMAPEHRRRLIEARAWLDADGEEAQGNRLSYYLTEQKFLAKGRDSAALERFFAAVIPSLPALRQRWDADTELSNRIACLPYYYADFLRGRGREEALAWVDSSLAWLKPRTKLGASLRQSDMGVVTGLAEAAAKRKDFARAEGYLLRYPGFLRDDADFRSALAWVYQEWASEAWDRKDWNGTIGILSKSLPYAAGGRLKSLRANLGSAYFNRAIEYANAGDWAKAKAALRQCLDRLPDEKRCRDRMQELLARQKPGE